MYRIVALFVILLSVFTAFSQGKRAVWLTTNAALDWPAPGQSEEARRQSLCVMLDKLQKAHVNMVLFQVQANGDVAWNSKIQPSMAVFTGNGAKKLSADVCRFVIDECHRRGMECHAWVVPFRLGTAKAAVGYARNPVKHVIKSHPELCVRYKGAYYLDPGNPEARKYLVKLYKELFHDYKFDGINLDYTRYPGADFPDGDSFRRHNPGKLSLNDWRRGNINEFVASVHKAIKKIDKDIVVGSAPIGTYKNVGRYKNSTAFDTFQQDPGQWIGSGHHDLVIPQMYWGEDFGFSAHLDTWKRVASDDCSLMVGLAPYKMVDGKWKADNVIDLVKKAESDPEVDGVCFFRLEHLLGNHKEVKKLYRYLVENPPVISGTGQKTKEKSIGSVEKFLE